MIKTIWFDLGNVILDFDFTPAFKKISRHTAWKLPRIRRYFCTNPEMEAALDEGRMPAKKLYRRLCRDMSLSNLPYGRFKQIWNHIFKRNSRVASLIPVLKRKGYRLLLISNTNKLHFDYLADRYTVLRYFDKKILSYRIKCRKPKKRIYQIALSLSDASPHEIFYTDDRSELTRAAESNHGVYVHTFRSAPGLFKALREHKVDIGARCDD
jgi:glucose-1-phosphatase